MLTTSMTASPNRPVHRPVSKHTLPLPNPFTQKTPVSICGPLENAHRLLAAQRARLNILPYPTGVQIRDNMILVNGQPRLIRGGSIQWFRLPEAEWPTLLKRFKAAGFNTVDMYVPWRDIQPRDPRHFPNGQSYDPNILAQMTRFLKLVQSEGLMVYFRPGPYICDEYDGGGIPNWVRTHASKNNAGQDPEKIIMRSADPNWLAACSDYLNTVNAHIRPYLASNGGPIILYAIENEFDHFERMWEVEKHFRVNGQPERPADSAPNTTAYFTALYQMTRHSGIDIPITTCPGQPKIGGYGEADAILPLPNNYQLQQFQKTSQAIVRDTHERVRLENKTVPVAGYTETPPRSASLMSSALMSGMKTFFAFNLIGFYQNGYRNTMILNPGAMGFTFNGMSPIAPAQQLIALTPNNAGSLFLSAPMGYMNNYMDFYGPIGATGALREKFYAYRRTNSFFNAFEPLLAAARPPLPTTSDVKNPVSFRPPRNCKASSDFWIDAGNKTSFLHLKNESGTTQIVPPGSIRIYDQTLPRYTSLAIPSDNYPGHPHDPLERDYSLIITAGVPLTPGVRLQYTTAEVLTQQTFNQKKLMVLYGEPGQKGELSLNLANGPLKVVHSDTNFTIHETNPVRFDTSFEYAPNRQLLLETPTGEQIQIIVTTRDQAGRTWFVQDGQHQVMLTNVDYLEANRKSPFGRTYLDFETGLAHQPLTVSAFSERPCQLTGFSAVRPFDPVSGLTVFQRDHITELPRLNPHLLGRGQIWQDNGESQPDFDDSRWLSWTGNPPALEQVGIYEGHAWYRTEINLDENGLKQAKNLHIDSAGDFVGIYINGHYLSTLAPVGTPIESTWRSKYYVMPDIQKYLRPGRNVLAFRTEIWGHGAFASPQGSLYGKSPTLPGVSLDALKGLQGNARLGNIPLVNWKIRPGLGSELSVPATHHLQAVTPKTPGSLPLPLKPGAVTWYETTFNTADLPDPTAVDAPVALQLKGQSAKATIYLNGQLIGRWLSDDAWLHRGTWASPTREMWSWANPDHTPLSQKSLQPGQNLLQIAFEDTSGPGIANGLAADVSIVYNQEELSVMGDHTIRAPAVMVKGSTELK